MALCSYKNINPEKALLSAFSMIDIEKHQKYMLEMRFLNVLHEFRHRANRLSLIFNVSRIIVTVGSILVPALLSIQYVENTPWMNQNTFQLEVYWSTWVLSLMITICNGLITLFKIDKKYFFVHTSLELLHSEGWQYIGLTGRYAPKDHDPKMTHSECFVKFCHVVEKIKMRQVEEEYWKFTDSTATTGAQAQGKQSMLSITPSQQQTPLANQPIQQQMLMGGWLEDMRTTDNKNSRQPVDVAYNAKNTSVSKVSPAAEGGYVPMQSELQEATPTGEAVVQSSRLSEIPENTFVQIMSDEPNERLRAGSGYGIVESER